MATVKVTEKSPPADCPGCGRTLVDIPWSRPPREWSADGKKLVEARSRRYIRVCDNRDCRLYRNPRGSFDGPCVPGVVKGR